MKTIASATVALAILSVAGHAHGQLRDLNALPGGSIAPLNAPPGLYEYATATKVSEDGQMVVGTSNARPVRFSLDGNRPVALSANQGAATGIANDGSVVGWRLVAGFQAVQWTSSNVATVAPSLAGSSTYFNGVSRDGSVKVGYGLVGSAFRAALYTSSGWSQIGTRPGATSFQIGNGISRDGSTVIGADDLGAFKWTRNGGFATLNLLAGIVTPGAFGINGVSANGQVLVGTTVLSSGQYAATVWNGSDPINAGSLPGYAQTVLNSVSNDGRAAIGYAANPANGIPANDARGYRAVYWSVETGLVDLNTLVADLGFSVPNGGILTVGADISGDGRVLVGNYQNPLGEIRAFHLTIPTPAATGLLGLAGLVAMRRRRTA